MISPSSLNSRASRRFTSGRPGRKLRAKMARLFSISSCDRDAGGAQHAGLPQDADGALELDVDFVPLGRLDAGCLAPLQQTR